MMAPDVVDCLIETGDDFQGKDEVEVLGVPVLLGAGFQSGTIARAFSSARTSTPAFGQPFARAADTGDRTSSTSAVSAELQVLGRFALALSMMFTAISGRRFFHIYMA